MPSSTTARAPSVRGISNKNQTHQTHQSPRDQRQAERDKKKSSTVVGDKNRKQKNLGFDSAFPPRVPNNNSIANSKSNTKESEEPAPITVGHQNNISSLSRSNFHSTGDRKGNDTESSEHSSSKSKDSTSESDDDHRMDDNYRENTKHRNESDEDLSHDELDEDDFDCVGGKKPKSQKEIFNDQPPKSQKEIFDDFPGMLIGTNVRTDHYNVRRGHDKRVSIGDSTLSSRFSNVSRDRSLTESQTVADTKKIEERMLSKKNTLYEKLTENEILRIGWYVRDDLFRRLKIVSESMMRNINVEVSRVLEINELVLNEKYSDISHCVKLNLNYRRAYVTKKIRNLLRGKPKRTTCVHILL
jgi:hypothetical protein